MTKQKRDNAYYLGRLSRDRPDLHVEVLAGRMTVNKARQIAGLGATRTRLGELKNAWTKATWSERRNFLVWIKASIPPTVITPSVARPAIVSPAARSAFDGDQHMLRWARDRIPEIMRIQGMRPGDVAAELGLSRSDVSVTNAAKYGNRVKRMSTAAKIERWLVTNAKVV